LLDTHGDSDVEESAEMLKSVRFVNKRNDLLLIAERNKRGPLVSIIQLRPTNQMLY